jgi:hypothetical protein
MGTSKLAKQRHSCTTELQLARWRARWERARSGQAFFPGDRDRSLGNNDCKLHLGDGKGSPDLLIITPPKPVRERLKVPTVTLELKGFSAKYARETLRSALSADEEQLARRQAAFDAGLPARKGGKVAKRRPTACARDIACRSPLTVRIWVDEDGVLRVALSILRSITLPAVISDGLHGGVGIDINPDHLAVCRVNKHGNPVYWERFALRTKGTHGQRQGAINDAVRAAVKLAVADPERGWEAVPIFVERLNFGYARLNLRYLAAKLANKLSAFAYRAILNLIRVRGANLGIEVRAVSPAFTSLLGQANYSSPHGVSVDLAAACCIARRGKRLREHVRPRVLERAPVDARKTTPSQAQSRLGLVIALPKRSETSACSWLARDDRTSANPQSSGGTRQTMHHAGPAAGPVPADPHGSQRARRHTARTKSSRPQPAHTSAHKAA